MHCGGNGVVRTMQHVNCQSMPELLDTEHAVPCAGEAMGPPGPGGDGVLPNHTMAVNYWCVADTNAGHITTMY